MNCIICNKDSVFIFKHLNDKLFSVGGLCKEHNFIHINNECKNSNHIHNKIEAMELVLFLNKKFLFKSKKMKHVLTFIGNKNLELYFFMISDMKNIIDTVYKDIIERTNEDLLVDCVMKKVDFVSDITEDKRLQRFITDTSCEYVLDERMRELLQKEEWWMSCEFCNTLYLTDNYPAINDVDDISYDNLSDRYFVCDNCNEFKRRMNNLFVTLDQKYKIILIEHVLAMNICLYKDIIAIIIDYFFDTIIIELL
jgi:hypothetical protein